MTARKHVAGSQKLLRPKFLPTQKNKQTNKLKPYNFVYSGCSTIYNNRINVYSTKG